MRDKIKIESKSRVTRIELYDISGRLIMEQTYNLKKVKLDLKNLIAGVYIVKIYTVSGAPVLRRVIKVEAD